jgi:hypothetical protein
MSLEEAIAACEKEKFLSRRAGELSTVVRGYRNLIHAGRVVRMRETVDEDGARVALALVKMIINEVASRKTKNFGYTAEQIVTKVQQDLSVRSILPYLLKETQESEVERLLTTVLPRRYYEEASDPDTNPKILLNMRLCFREGWDQSSESLKKVVAKRFVKIVKEEGGDFVGLYEAAFFSGGDLLYLSDEERMVAKRHVLSRLTEDEGLPFDAVFQIMKGIGS